LMAVIADLVMGWLERALSPIKKKKKKNLAGAA
ncbi:ABC transporter permease, partial [Bacillus spizizenii]|nr:ABC transporter permease [Bacillus spizizenii]